MRQSERARQRNSHLLAFEKEKRNGAEHVVICLADQWWWRLIRLLVVCTCTHIYFIDFIYCDVDWSIYYNAKRVQPNRKTKSVATHISISSIGWHTDGFRFFASQFGCCCLCCCCHNYRKPHQYYQTFTEEKKSMHTHEHFKWRKKKQKYVE